MILETGDPEKKSWVVDIENLHFKTESVFLLSMLMPCKV